MAKKVVHDLQVTGKETTVPMIFCPGCNFTHVLDDRWTFNGDYEKPTFTPSLLIKGGVRGITCHSFITDGKIKYLGDCTHDMKNQTVELKGF